MLGQYEAFFPNGETRASFNVSVFEDGIREDDETFSLTISNNNLINRVMRSGNRGRIATVTIVDTTGELCGS